MVFVDTSAFYAIADRDDLHHARAREVWQRLIEERRPMLTNNYVLLETSAPLQRRVGFPAVRAFDEDVVPILGVDWVTADAHQIGVEAMLAAGRKELSLVDCVSFYVTRRAGAKTAFCFDSRFREQGSRFCPEAVFVRLCLPAATRSGQNGPRSST